MSNCAQDGMLAVKLLKYTNQLQGIVAVKLNAKIW